MVVQTHFCMWIIMLKCEGSGQCLPAFPVSGKRDWKAVSGFQTCYEIPCQRAARGRFQPGWRIRPPEPSCMLRPWITCGHRKPITGRKGQNRVLWNILPLLSGNAVKSEYGVPGCLGVLDLYSMCSNFKASYFFLSLISIEHTHMHFPHVLCI